MSFSGKKWKRVGVENAAEFVEALKIADRVKDLFKQGETVSSYTKQNDGTFTYKVEAGGKVVEERNFAIDEEQEFTLLDGSVFKTKYSLEGEILKQHIKLSDGQNVYLERIFSGDTMKMKMSADGVEVVAHVEYKAV